MYIYLKLVLWRCCTGEALQSLDGSVEGALAAQRSDRRIKPDLRRCTVKRVRVRVSPH